MAKQCGPLFFEGTWDDITFYKMEGEYYARWKSSLTRERVLTDPAFIKTRLSADLMAAASPIASSIYSQLPIGWRQKWMFNEFTGEAKIMLQHEHTPEEAYDYLWKTYVEYWVIYQQVTGIPLKTGRTAKKKKPRQHKTILRHRGSDDKYSRRYYNQLGKRHRRSNYDHTQDLQAIDEKQKRKALNDAAWQKTLDKEKRLKEEEALTQAAVVEVQELLNTPEFLRCHPEPACPPKLKPGRGEECAEDRITSLPVARSARLSASQFYFVAFSNSKAMVVTSHPIELRDYKSRRAKCAKGQRYMTNSKSPPLAIHQ